MRSVIVLILWATFSFCDDICVSRFINGVRAIPQYGSSLEDKQKSYATFYNQIRQLKKTAYLEFLVFPEAPSMKDIVFLEFWNKYQREEFMNIFFEYRNKKSWASSFWMVLNGSQVYYWKTQDGLIMSVYENLEAQKIYFYMSAN